MRKPSCERGMADTRLGGCDAGRTTPGIADSSVSERRWAKMARDPNRVQIRPLIHTHDHHHSTGESAPPGSGDRLRQ